MLDPLIVRIVSVSFALLFLLSAVHKLTAIDRFRAVLTDYQLLPDAIVPLTARVVPVIELLLGVGWLTFVQIELVALASAALLSIYTAAIGINIYRGRVHIGCGCGFGGAAHDDQQLSFGLVLRNCSLVFAALVATLPIVERQLGIVDYVTLVAAVLATVLLYVAANQLLQNGAAINSWRQMRRPKHD